MSALPRVSAIVPSLDRPDWLARSLAALAAARPAFLEVVVADQSEGGAARALCERHGARHLALTARGLSRARNAALREVRGEFVAFPDDDATVAPDFVTAFAAAVASAPRAAFICGHVTYPSGRTMQPGMDGRARALASVEDVLHTAVSPGLVVRRDALARAGGFDERLGVGAEYPSGEESDLLIRLLQGGESGWYAPALRVAHPDPFEIRDDAGTLRRMHAYGRGWGALFAKHSRGPDGPRFANLQRRYERRAWLGALAYALRLDLRRAREYRAAHLGRRAGWRDWLAREDRA